MYLEGILICQDSHRTSGTKNIYLLLLLVANVQSGILTRKGKNQLPANVRKKHTNQGEQERRAEDYENKGSHGEEVPQVFPGIAYVLSLTLA